MADQKTTQLTAGTPISTDIAAYVADPGGTPVSKKTTFADVMALSSDNAVVDGRLTLETGVAVSTTAQTAKTTVYFTPYKGYKIALYDGSVYWDIVTFTEISVAVPATTVTPFDVFCYNNAGTATLETVNWTNDTTRATALTLQNGVYVKTGATTRRYLGTCRTTSASGQTEDSISSRFLWNYYNRVRKNMLCYDATDTWNYTTATWRAANNNTTVGTGRVECVIGVAEVLCRAINNSFAVNSTAPLWAAGGIAVNATNANHAQLYGGRVTNAVGLVQQAIYTGYLAAGYSYIQRVEISEASNTTTWYGDGGAPTYILLGMTADIEG